MIPKVINYCWFGHNKKPRVVRKCIKSWKKICPDYDIKEWNEYNYDIDANYFTKEAYKEKKWAFVSDYARLEIMYKYGGVYLDTDVELIKNFDSVIGYNSFFAMDSGGINTGIGFGAEAENNMVKKLLEKYEAEHFIVNGKPDISPCTIKNSAPFTEAGWNLETGDIQELAGTVLLPKEYFDPIDGVNSELRVTSNTIGIHWGNRSWESGLNGIKARVRVIIGLKNTSIIKKIGRKILGKLRKVD